MELPAIDQNICGAWTQQQNDLYNKLPFYFMEGEASNRKWWASWSRLFGKIPWKANMGATMRTVIAEPSPILRQQAFPNKISGEVPKADIVNYRERKLDSQPSWQDFATPHFYFLPEFQDFMRHIDRTIDNLNRQINVFEDVFYRTQCFHRSPYVYVAGVGLVSAPTGEGSADGSTGKTNAWLQAQFTALSGAQEGYLSFKELFKVLNAGEQEIGMTPYDGSGLPKADSEPLAEKYCLIGSNEIWNNFVDDPWVKENRPLGMDIVVQGFKGDIFGRIRFKSERYPMRYGFSNANFAPVQYAPESVEEAADREDFGRTVPNPAYARITNPADATLCSPVAVAFLLGGSVGEVINVGPPPPEFTRDQDQGTAIKMNWNGKSYLTKNFLVPCKDAAGNTQYVMNEFGRYMRAQATAALGMRLQNPQNILPIIYKRRVGINTVT